VIEAKTGNDTYVQNWQHRNKVMYINEAHPHAPFVDLMLSTQIQPFRNVVHLDQLIHKRTFTFYLAKVWRPSQFD
jgi:hypothetical protein